MLEGEESSAVTLDDRTGVSEEDRQAEAAALTDRLSRAGAFETDDSGKYRKQAHWMVYCALIVESMCKLDDIENLVADTQNRQELLHEAMLHFGNPEASPWNIAQEVEAQMLAFEPYRPPPHGDPTTAFESVTGAMARFRAASDGGEILGSWLAVWSSISGLIAELLSEIVVRGGR